MVDFTMPSLQTRPSCAWSGRCDGRGTMPCGAPPPSITRCWCRMQQLRPPPPPPTRQPVASSAKSAAAVSMPAAAAAGSLSAAASVQLTQRLLGTDTMPWLRVWRAAVAAAAAATWRLGSTYGALLLLPALVTWLAASGPTAALKPAAAASQAQEMAVHESCGRGARRGVRNAPVG